MVPELKAWRLCLPRERVVERAVPSPSIHRESGRTVKEGEGLDDGSAGEISDTLEAGKLWGCFVNHVYSQSQCLVWSRCTLVVQVSCPTCVRIQNPTRLSRTTQPPAEFSRRSPVAMSLHLHFHLHLHHRMPSKSLLREKKRIMSLFKPLPYLTLTTTIILNTSHLNDTQLRLYRLTPSHM